MKPNPKNVRNMFEQIAYRYDLLNNLMSFNFHKKWRKFALSLISPQKGDKCADICCGTGDFTLACAQTIGDTGYVIGLDFSPNMIKQAEEKTKQTQMTNVVFSVGDALNLPFPSDFFSFATIGWGIRNLQDAKSGFTELTRIIKTGGKVVCIDMAKPQSKFLLFIYSLHMKFTVPFMGKIFSHGYAYRYLPDSVESFYDRETLSNIMKSAGLINIKWYDLAFGAVCIHMGEKP